MVFGRQSGAMGGKQWRTGRKVSTRREAVCLVVSLSVVIVIERRDIAMGRVQSHTGRKCNHRSL